MQRNDVKLKRFANIWNVSWMLLNDFRTLDNIANGLKCFGNGLKFAVNENWLSAISIKPGFPK